MVETGVPIHNHAIQVQLSLIQQTTAVARHQGHTLVIAKSVAFRVTQQKKSFLQTCSSTISASILVDHVFPAYFIHYYTFPTNIHSCTANTLINRHTTMSFYDYPVKKLTFANPSKNSPSPPNSTMT
jgi:hypothetical protein